MVIKWFSFRSYFFNYIYSLLLTLILNISRQLIQLSQNLNHQTRLKCFRLETVPHSSKQTGTLTHILEQMLSLLFCLFVVSFGRGTECAANLREPSPRVYSTEFDSYQRLSLNWPVRLCSYLNHKYVVLDMISFLKHAFMLCIYGRGTC